MRLPSHPGQPLAERPARLLIAEDDAVLRSLVTAALEREGHETLEAVDGEEALRLAIRHLGSLDLLLTDDQTPGRNGYELIRVLRALRPSLKVVVMSGANSVGPLPSDVAILLKPFTLEALSGLVASRLVGAEDSEAPGNA